MSVDAGAPARRGGHLAGRRRSFFGEGTGVQPSSALSEIEDQNAVRRLVAFYSDAVTHLDPVRAASVYAEDGCARIANVEVVGRLAIEAGMRKTFSAFQLLQMIEHAGLITIDHDRASARWSTIELTVRRESTELNCIFGRYEDELVRQPDGWRFQKRVFTMAGRMLIESAKLQYNPDFASTLISGLLA